MKEAITETRPLVLDALLKIPANFYVVTEWTPLPADKARKEVNKRRRHFNMSKTGFVSQMGNNATQENPLETWRERPNPRSHYRAETRNFRTVAPSKEVYSNPGFWGFDWAALSLTLDTAWAEPPAQRANRKG
jgi:hypothetical protein